MKKLPFNKEFLESFLNYCLISGLFYYKETGKRVRSRFQNGRNCIKIKDKQYLSSRVAWLYVTGKDPFPFEIDHRNTIKDDDSFKNLRKSTRSQNASNKPGLRNGFKGISKSSKNSWRARIKQSGKTICLGSFGSEKEAYNAYCIAAKKIHKEFANLT